MTRKFRLLLFSGGSAVLVAGILLWVALPSPGQPDKRLEAQELLAAGIAMFTEQKYEQALEALQRVPQSSEYASKARYYEGSTHLMLRDFESAIAALDRAVALNDEDVGSLFALGVAYFKLGNLKMAKAHFSLVLDAPNDDGSSTELKEQAQGLVDVMAKLERRQETVAAPKPGLTPADPNDSAD
jgi:tetratricopeptide (TPR) repeat protein